MREKEIQGTTRTLQAEWTDMPGSGVSMSRCIEARKNNEL
jgi:hypothetical protein